MTIFAIDGVGAVGESSTILNSGSRRLNEMFTSIPSFDKLISNLDIQASIGSIEGVIDGMNCLEVLLEAPSSYWSNNSHTIISTVLKALKLLDGVEMSDLIASASMYNVSLLEKMISEEEEEGEVVGGVVGVEKDELIDLLLKIGTSSPSPHMSSLNRIRFYQSVEMMMDGVWIVSFGRDGKDSISTRECLNKLFKLNSTSSELFSSLSKMSMMSSKTWIERNEWKSVSMNRFLVDVQFCLKEGSMLISHQNGISVRMILNQNSLPSRSIFGLPTTTWIFKNRTFPLLPTDDDITPLHYVAQISTNVSIRASFKTSFDLLLFSSSVYSSSSPTTNLVCATMSDDSIVWTDNCNRPVLESDKIVCDCPFIGRSVSVSVLHRDALCKGYPPSEGKYYCENGKTWVSIGSIDQSSLKPNVPVVIQGNLSTDTIIFEGLGGSVFVTECALVKVGIEVELTPEEIEALERGDPITTVLLRTGGLNCEHGVGDIPIIANINDKCRKLIVTPGGSSSVLSATFRIEKLDCHKNLWWVILLCVLAGLLVLVAVLVVLSKTTKFKFTVRPFAKVKARRHQEQAPQAADDGEKSDYVEMSSSAGNIP